MVVPLLCWRIMAQPHYSLLAGEVEQPMRTAVKALKGSHLLPLREALGGPVLPMEVPGSPDWEVMAVMATAEAVAEAPLVLPTLTKMSLCSYVMSFPQCTK